jgi:transposase-like protein
MQKRYTAEQREQLVEAVRARGESVGAAAARLGVSASTAYLWMKAARSGGRPQFARLVRQSQVKPAALVVRVGDVAIAVEAGFDVELLRAVVGALSTRVT